MRFPLRCFLLALVAVATASPASAAVVSVDDREYGLEFFSRPGEAHVLTITYSVVDAQEGRGTTTISYRGAPVQAGSGCRKVDRATVSCTRTGQWVDNFLLGDRRDVVRAVGAAGYLEFNVLAGAGDDQITLPSFRGTLDADISGDAGDDALSVGSTTVSTFIGGGPGKDTVRGGPGDDSLWGDEGDDVLIGGPGRDSFRGGAGNDVLSARDGARDRVEGDGGFDRACIDRGHDRVITIEALACRRGPPLTGRRTGRQADRSRLLGDAA